MKRVQMLVREGTPHRWGEKTTAHLTHLHCCCVAVLTPIPLGARQTRAPQVPPRSHTLTRCGGMISSGSPAPSLGWSLHSSRWACFPQWVSATPVKKASAMAMVCPPIHTARVTAVSTLCHFEWKGCRYLFSFGII